MTVPRSGASNDTSTANIQRCSSHGERSNPFLFAMLPHGERFPGPSIYFTIASLRCEAAERQHLAAVQNLTWLQGNNAAAFQCKNPYGSARVAWVLMSCGDFWLVRGRLLSFPGGCQGYEFFWEVLLAGVVVYPTVKPHLASSSAGSRRSPKVAAEAALAARAMRGAPQ